MLVEVVDGAHWAYGMLGRTCHGGSKDNHRVVVELYETRESAISRRGRIVGSVRLARWQIERTDGARRSPRQPSALPARNRRKGGKGS